MRDTRSLGWVCIALAAAAVLLPYLSVLLDPGLALLYRDLTQTALPTKALWVYGVEELGRVPHWNPYSLAGTPFLANSNPGPLYPLNWLIYFFRGFGLPRALFFFILAHHWLLFLGGYFLLRELRVRVWLAVAGAWALALGGFAMSSDNLLHILGGQLGIVFFLAFWVRALRARGWWSVDLPLASLALAWPIYASDPQFTYLGGVMAFVWAWRVTGFRRALPLSLLLLLGTILAAGPQLFPTLAFLPETGRGAFSLQDLEIWSMHPIRWLEVFLPLPFGSTVNPGEYWGHVYLNSGGRMQPFIFSLYPGLFSTFFLSLWVLHRARAQARLVAAVSFSFLLAACLAMGEFSPVPLFAFLAKFVPAWNSFRHPERLAYWLSFFWILLGTAAGEQILLLPKNSLRTLLKRSALFFIPVYLALAIWLLWRNVSVFPALHAAIVVASFAGILWRSGRFSVHALLTVAALDLGVVAERLVWPQPVAMTDPARLPWLQKLRAHEASSAEAKSKGEASRFYAASEGPIDFRYVPAEAHTTRDLFAQWAKAVPNTPAYWRLEDVRGFYGLQPKRLVDLWNLLSVSHPDRLLNLLSVRYWLKLENLEPRAFVNQGALPFAKFFARVEFHETEASVWARLSSAGWDPGHLLLLEANFPEARSPAEWEILSVRKNWDEIDLRLRARRAGGERFLLLNESFSPFWHVKNAGTETELRLVRANAWAQAALLPAAVKPGEELQLKWRYRDPWYSWGKGAFALWLTAFLASLFFRYRQRAVTPLRGDR